MSGAVIGALVPSADVAVTAGIVGEGDVVVAEVGVVRPARVLQGVVGRVREPLEVGDPGVDGEALVAERRRPASRARDRYLPRNSPSLGRPFRHSLRAQDPQTSN